MKKLFVIVIIVLLVGISTPSTGINVRESTSTSYQGKTLYVGGIGPGNYSKIQDAIDNASDQDTVFVYEGTYYEHLKIEKNINLFGEDKEKTIIDAEGIETGIEIGASVRLSGFTIQNAEEGISNFVPAPPNDNYEFLVFENILENNVVGFALSGTYKNVIYGNIIQNNQLGIKFFRANKYEVKNNNFINNEKHAHFEFVVFLQFMPRINWNGNYWDTWKVRIPKVVKGDIVIVFVFRPGWVLKESVCPCYNIDWHPKTNPYDI